ncbi:MAG: type II toxin-antitoxin system Phd/YefM family antitoxin [Deltaproteobacteria bacterium]|nr:type II toxin-antitoxin system Phd/YefM family antitoxin [Deltaproteobacteria bacterium]
MTTRTQTKTKDPSWQLQEAKSRLSQVVDHALREGPQTITLHGKPAVVVVSFEEFQNLIRPHTSLREFFRQSPLYDTDLDLERSKDLAREVLL